MPRRRRRRRRCRPTARRRLAPQAIAAAVVGQQRLAGKWRAHGVGARRLRHGAVVAAMPGRVLARMAGAAGIGRDIAAVATGCGRLARCRVARALPLGARFRPQRVAGRRARHQRGRQQQRRRRARSTQQRRRRRRRSASRRAAAPSIAIVAGGAAEAERSRSTLSYRVRFASRRPAARVKRRGVRFAS